MKKVLIWINAHDGCTMHRLWMPYKMVAAMSKDIELTFGIPKGTENKAEYLCTFDAVIAHRVVSPEILNEFLAKRKNTLLISDQDDYWRLEQTHPLYSQYRIRLEDEIRYTIEHSDYVTATTSILADKIRPLNKNVVVFPNALAQYGQFIKHDTPSDKIRFGIIGGSSHAEDVAMLDGFIQYLSPSVLKMCQFVLCGFDKGQLIRRGVDGEEVSVEMPWEQNVWTRMERVLTNNYKTIQPDHKAYLDAHCPNDYTTDEPYRRMWARNIDHYATFYDEIDVLLVPLRDSNFNRYKSELKLIEASTKGKAVICSNVQPYTDVLVNAYAGGQIMPDGNCLTIENRRGPKEWAKAITLFATNSHLRKLAAKNIEALTANGGKYNLERIGEERLKWLQSII